MKQASRVSRLGQIILVPTATACGAAGRLKEAECDTQLSDQIGRSAQVPRYRIAKTEDL